MREYLIYLLKFKDNSVYIGRTYCLKERFRVHKRDCFNDRCKGYNYPIYKHWRVIGEPEVEILESKLPYEVAKVREYEYTLAYLLLNFNILNQNIGDKKSEDWIQKHSGRNNGFYGRKHTDEVKAIISKANKGKRKGKDNHMFGRKLSDEAKQLLREVNTGANSHKAHPKEYYATNSTVRKSFKLTCKRMGWDFDNFIEIETEERTKCGHKKFLYVEKCLLTNTD